MKRISLRVSMLMLLVNSAGAQTDPSDWHRYSVKNEKFSVAFAAFGAPQDDERVTRFFSSVSLENNKDAFKLPDEMPSTAATTSGPDTPEKIFTSKEVDKSHQPILMVHPEYTEEARQAQIKGTVVLKCTLSANGQITTISVVSGLSHGLTERAIAAARKLKFIPAMKDGKYVSVSTQLVYRFDIY